MKKKCQICGKNELEKKKGLFRFSDDIEIPDSVWEECGSCGEIILSVELDDKIEHWQYFKDGLLFPDQIKRIRKKLGLTQKMMAEYLRVGEKNFSRWENGQTMQSKAMDMLIRLFESNPETIIKIHERREEKVEKEMDEYFSTLGTIKGSQKRPIAAHGFINNSKKRKVYQLLDMDREADKTEDG